MDIVGAISAINNSWTLMTKLREATKNLEQSEIKNLVADLSNELADAKFKIADLKNEVAALQEENARLKKGDSEVMILKGLYYKRSTGDGPFCTGCHDKEKKFIRVVELPDIMQHVAKWKCPVCDVKFK